MEIKIQAIHFEATEKLEKFIEKKVSKLGKFNDEIGRIEVSLKVVKPETAMNKEAALRVILPGIGFTGDMWEGIAPKHIVAALKAEGMKWFTATYGIVRKHMLFNLSQKYWRNAGDPVAEAVCKSNIVTMHMLMSAPGAAEQVVDALHKLAANVEELRQYAKNQ